MKKSYWLSALMLVALLGGCSKQDDDTSSVPQQQGRLPDDNVFSDQVKALEKAEGVQQTLDAAAAKQREDIEKQERQ
jgi:hypothetical protein